MNWSEALAYHMASQAPSVTSGLEASLFTLLLQFYSEKELLDTKVSVHTLYLPEKFKGNEGMKYDLKYDGARF